MTLKNLTNGFLILCQTIFNGLKMFYQRVSWHHTCLVTMRRLLKTKLK